MGDTTVAATGATGASAATGAPGAVAVALDGDSPSKILMRFVGAATAADGALVDVVAVAGRGGAWAGFGGGEGAFAMVGGRAGTAAPLAPVADLGRAPTPADRGGSGAGADSFTRLPAASPAVTFDASASAGAVT